jgi:hypothetical protein
MNTKPTRRLFTAVALSALAAVLASSAQARIAVGNGTKPPPGAVERAQQVLQHASAREKLGEIGAWAVTPNSRQKPQLVQQSSVNEKLGEIGAWAVPVGLP